MGNLARVIEPWDGTSMISQALNRFALCYAQRAGHSGHRIRGGLDLQRVAKPSRSSRPLKLSTAFLSASGSRMMPDRLPCFPAGILTQVFSTRKRCSSARILKIALRTSGCSP